MKGGRTISTGKKRYTRNGASRTDAPRNQARGRGPGVHVSRAAKVRVLRGNTRGKRMHFNRQNNMNSVLEDLDSHITQNKRESIRYVLKIPPLL